MKSYVRIAAQYCKDVLSEKVPACEYVKKACQRQVNDLKKEKTKAFPYRFNVKKASRVCAFIEKLPHIKGEWAGKTISLEPWQVFILTTVFGWERKKTLLRRFRTVYIEVPRKNGKSCLSSAVALYMLAADGEKGCEVYSAATTRDQARIVFDVAKSMAQRTEPFREHFGVDVNAHNLCILDSSSKFEPLSADADTLDGLNVHCAIIDELHAHKTRLVWDVMETATGSRTQPLVWTITTAGSNRAGICYEQRDYVLKLLNDVSKDETYFGIIYTVDEGDLWSDASTWKKANPNYGVSIYPDDLERLARKAMQLPSAVNNFLTKRLNVWVNADTAWMDMQLWEKCIDRTLTMDMFRGKQCYVGIDLASKIDLAPVVYVFPGEDGNFTVFCKSYLPEDAVESSSNSQYTGWVRSGHLLTTEGNVIDFNQIKEDLREFKSNYEIKEIAYDPFQATQFSVEMAQEGFPMVELGATVKNFSEPMKELEALVYKCKIHFDGDPVLTWAVSNVVCHRDAKDNIYPRKEFENNKIDPVVALLMALNRALLHVKPSSVYEERGILTI